MMGMKKRMKKGGLTGGQKKLDKNKDGKIDGKDFAMMKKGGLAKKKRAKAMGGGMMKKRMKAGGSAKKKRAKAMGGGMMKKRAKAMGGGMMKKRMKRGGKA